MRTSGGSSARAISSSLSRPWPIEIPGASEPWMVIERSRSKRLRFCGAAVSRKETKAESGTRSPGPERMKTFERSFGAARSWARAEEHTSELQSHSDLVCRLLLEKKKKQK